MLIIELISDTETFKFNPGQHISVYINEDQFIQVRIAKVLNRDTFCIHINGKKEKINKVEVVYQDV